MAATKESAKYNGNLFEGATQDNTPLPDRFVTDDTPSCSASGTPDCIPTAYGLVQDAVSYWVPNTHVLTRPADLSALLPADIEPVRRNWWTNRVVRSSVLQAQVFRLRAKTGERLGLMESFNASVPDESKSQLAVEGRSSNQKDQCTPMQSPPLGTLKLVAGNGTSIGTVMTLQCPYTHRAVSGGRVMCMQDSNRVQWTGGVPECKPLSRYEGQGFRLAVFASIVSLAIIIFMSVIFITSCLLNHVRREETKRRERERKREAAELWAQMDHQNFEEQRVAFHGPTGRNNNNNNNSNNNNTSNGSRPAQHTQHALVRPALSTQQPCNNQPAACRWHQERLRTSHPSNLPPVPRGTPHVNTQTSCALQSHSMRLQTGLLCSGCDRTLEEQPWDRPSPLPVDTQDWFSDTTGQSLEGVEDPFQKGQHSLGPQSPPMWVISV
ncbi:uncharacterized protein LOC113580445 isoform X1 [Electrophorus electricus]|uniref:uncharacterized protein LOC113580445 isoform X1 n=1 Tax=Electrophorus electricus TaxID=8005 RepID=UPI0015D07082|nr:uncharacterized protein LOC113580445 isoform X1 [Electrophorus electricus]